MEVGVGVRMELGLGRPAVFEEGRTEVRIGFGFGLGIGSELGVGVLGLFINSSINFCSESVSGRFSPPSILGNQPMSNVNKNCCEKGRINIKIDY